jgi:hypothetical protein
MYRGLSNLRMTRFVSGSIISMRLDDEAPAGWTTRGTSLADFHHFRASSQRHETSSERASLLTDYALLARLLSLLM